MNGESDQEQASRERPIAAVWLRRPPVGTVVLVLLHFAVMAATNVASGPGGAPYETLFVLYGSASHPAAILLHGLGASSYAELVLVMLAIWVLAGPVERRFGTARVLMSYALATLVSGAVYFGFSQAASELAIYPLRVPSGAAAAWVIAARAGLDGDSIRFGARRYSIAQVVTVIAAVVAGLVFFLQGERSTAWLLATLSGGLTWCAVGGRRGGRIVAPWT